MTINDFDTLSQFAQGHKEGAKMERTWALRGDKNQWSLRPVCPTQEEGNYPMRSAKGFPPPTHRGIPNLHRNPEGGNGLPVEEIQKRVKKIKQETRNAWFYEYEHWETSETEPTLNPHQKRNRASE